MRLDQEPRSGASQAEARAGGRRRERMIRFTFALMASERLGTSPEPDDPTAEGW